MPVTSRHVIQIFLLEKLIVGNAALGVPFGGIFVRLWNGEGAVPYKKLIILQSKVLKIDCPDKNKRSRLLNLLPTSHYLVKNVKVISLDIEVFCIVKVNAFRPARAESLSYR